ncbi:MAG: twin-arginine translocase TatA/TatE family subunit [Firmicutes bacterium]|nr:twin-arginine translocase TatA/TatE family subunit [Bacillota bacterium]
MRIGTSELLLIFALAFLLFGPKKLPEIGRALGKGLREFRQATTELKESVNVESKE